MEKFYYIFILFLSVWLILTNGQIAFPEGDEQLHTSPSQNSRDRQPFYVPGKCPVNQLYYPGNRENDWVCDCAPRFVYYPPDDMCYEVYRQGPCPINEYLVLKNSQVIPECIRNPCINDTMVPFNGKCQKLHRTNGCPPLHMGGGTLEVNATTLRLECLPGNAAELNIITAPIVCPQGSKRSASGKCRQPI